MPSRWIEFVREWAKKNNMTYSCALSQPKCSQEYRAKYGVSKKIPVNKEKEMMGAEDINRAKKPKKPKKPKKKIELVIEELDNGKEEDNKKRLIELSRMLGEDINRAEKVVKKAPAKKAKAPRKLPDDVIIEEEVKEKPSPEGLYARLKALQIAENAPAKNKMEIEKMMGEDINRAEKKAPAKKAKAPRKLPDDVVIEEEKKKEDGNRKIKVKRFEIKHERNFAHYYDKPIVIFVEGKYPVKGASVYQYGINEEGESMVIQIGKLKTEEQFLNHKYIDDIIESFKVKNLIVMPKNTELVNSDTGKVFENEELEERRKNHKEYLEEEEEEERKVGFINIKKWVTDRYYASNIKQLAGNKKYLNLSLRSGVDVNPASVIVSALKAGEITLYQLIENCRKMEKSWREDNKKKGSIPQKLKSHNEYRTYGL